MRTVVALAILVAASIVGGILLAPWLVNWEHYRDDLTEAAEELTGQTVAITGRIDFNPWPRPHLTLADTTFERTDQSDGSATLEIDRLDLQLKPLALLRGELDIEALRLVRPLLLVDDARQPDLVLARLLGGGALMPTAADAPRRIAVVDGRAVIRGDEGGPVRELGAINIEAEATSPFVPISLRGDFSIEGDGAVQPFRFTARVGRPSDEGSSSLQLDVNAERDGGVTSLNFRGIVWWQAETRLRGDLALAGDHLGRSIELLRQLLAPPTRAAGPDERWSLPAVATPFRLEAGVRSEQSRIALEELSVQVGRTEMRGRMALALGQRPDLDLELGIREATLEHLPPAAVVGAWTAPLVGIARTMRGHVDLSVNALNYRNDTVQRVRAEIELGGDGGLTVQQLGAVLPGSLEVRFTGALSTGEAAVEPAGPVLSGRVSAVTDDLATSLEWLGIRTEGVSDGRLKTLTLAGDLALDRSQLRLAEAELRLDAARAIGSIAVNFGARPQVAAAIDVDRINLDAYLPDRDAGELMVVLGSALEWLDMAIEARIDKLTWRGLRLDGVDLDSRSIAGQLSINRLVVADLADATAEVTGEVEVATGRFDLASEWRAVRPARLMRQLGLEPPAILTRVAPLSIALKAAGSAARFETGVEIADGRGQLALGGEVTVTDGGIGYEFDVEADHPDTAAVFRQLGALVGAGESAAAPSNLTGKLIADGRGGGSVAGTARIAGTSITGRIDWENGAAAARPRIASRLSIGEPSAEVVAALLGVAGLRLDPRAVAEAARGSWPDQPLAWEALDRFDGDLELSGKGGLAGDGIELSARLDQGEVSIERLHARVWGGVIEARATLFARRELPYLTATVAVQDVAADALAAWLNLDPGFAGRLDLDAEVSAAGHSVRDLVQGLIGETEIRLRNGRLPPIDPTRLGQDVDQNRQTPADANRAGNVLAGTFALDRGIASADAVTLDLNGIQATLDGSIDWYLWAVDLALTPSLAGVELPATIRIVGPIDRPYVRVGAPSEGPEPATLQP